MPHGTRAIEPRIDQNGEAAWRLTVENRRTLILGCERQKEGGVSVEVLDDERHSDRV